MPLICPDAVPSQLPNVLIWRGTFSWAS